MRMLECRTPVATKQMIPDRNYWEDIKRKSRNYGDMQPKPLASDNFRPKMRQRFMQRCVWRVSVTATCANPLYVCVLTLCQCCVGVYTVLSALCVYHAKCMGRIQQPFPFFADYSCFVRVH